MSALYRVQAAVKPHHTDPLHYGNFFPDKLRHHAGVMNKRQDLILYLANLHASATKSGMPLGMIQIQMRLMSLRDWCQDYRLVLDHFFEVKQLGFNLGDGNHEISTLIPKNLRADRISNEASKAAVNLKYSPPPRPEDSAVVSKVYIQQDRGDTILKKLVQTARLDLYAPVEWLLSQPEVNFHFVRAGKLQMRDTSIWPVQAIETWPSWLREELFGPGVDIDSAYTQFIVGHLREAYADTPKIFELVYPDLIRSLEDKAAWRREICIDILGLEPTEENIGTVKRLCMSLANGSRISPAILTGSRAFSVTADIVFASTNDVSLMNLNRIGKRLSRISDQYKNARKMICVYLLGVDPTRVNQKKVFESYFGWEREARYLIWEHCDRHGVMVHDGIDGIPSKYLQDLPKLMKEIDIRLTHT